MADVLVSIRVGQWWLLNGHLYRAGVSRNANYERTPIQWKHWRCVFCGIEPHQLRQRVLAAGVLASSNDQQESPDGR